MSTSADEQPTEALAASPAPAEHESFAAGELLGEFRIEALLGRGGMGEVYRAAQLQPVQRTVAIKRLHARALSPQQRARFEVERQVLAQMQHPAIAQLFDAGALPDGSPYFVMEYIDGTPITQFCRDQRLPLKPRLGLFLHLLEGVQHAHQRGVIHRDLKPGNILVTRANARPLPKIIDFGIASATAASEAEVAGTRDYMSPEQFNPQLGALDTRSDIYALGVILHELLTGARPGDVSSSAALQTRTTAPMRPSDHVAALPEVQSSRLAASLGLRSERLRSILRDDLDWVVMKAIATRREDRYPSVAAFAEDLERYLGQRPVHAHPGGRFYRGGKFVRRHRIAVAAGSVALVAILSGLGLALYGLRAAHEQGELAEQRRAELEQVAAFQQQLLRDIDPSLFGQALLRIQREQLQRTPFVQAMPADRREQALRLLELGNGTDLARELLDQQILARALAVIDGGFSAQPLLAARLRESVAELYQSGGRYPRAAELYTQIHQTRVQQLGAMHADTLRAALGQGRALLAAGVLTGARSTLQRLQAEAATVLASDDPLRIEIGIAWAELLAAESAFEASNAVLVDLLAGSRGVTRFRAQALRAGNLLRLEQREPAQALITQALAEAATSQDPQDPEWQQALSGSVALRADAGDLAGALALSEQLYAAAEARLGAEHPFTLTQLNNRAVTLIRMERFAAAIELLRPLLATRSRVLGARHPHTLKTQANLGSALTRWMQLDPQHVQRPSLLQEAVASQREVLAARVDLLGPEHADTLLARASLGSMLAAAGQPEEGLEHARAALTTNLRLHGENHPHVANDRELVADILLQLGEREAASVLYRQVLAVREVSLGQAHPQTRKAATGLMRSLPTSAGERQQLARAYGLGESP